MTVQIQLGDCVLIVKSLTASAERAEQAAAQLQDLAPELRARAARLRRIAAALDEGTEALQ